MVAVELSVMTVLRLRPLNLVLSRLCSRRGDRILHCHDFTTAEATESCAVGGDCAPAEVTKSCAVCGDSATAVVRTSCAVCVQPV